LLSTGDIWDYKKALLLRSNLKATDTRPLSDLYTIHVVFHKEC
jgi:hypothetical protein